MPPPTLSHVVLASREVAATGAVLQALGLSRHEVACTGAPPAAVFAIGETALVLVPLGHALIGGRDKPGVDHIALRCADPRAAAAALAAKGIALAADTPPGLVGLPQVALAPADLVGVRVCLSQALSVPPAPSALVGRIDHLGIASADNQAAIRTFCGGVGLVLESQQTDMEVSIAVESFTSDKYGVVYHSRPPQPVGGLRVAFITAGDCELEFLQNFDPDQGSDISRGAAGTTRQDQSAIARFVATRGPGLHHVAFNTADIDATLAALARAGVALIDRTGRPGSRRARIGFLHPSGAGGVLFHLVQRP